MIIKEGSWDAGRVFQSLGRIGYDPVSAILDLVDNSVSAGATSIIIKVNEERAEQAEGRRGRPRAVLKSFTIVDDGCGMDEDGLHNALTLGSSAQLYREDTLSRFGIGLKSAASSLGKQLEIISRAECDLNDVRKVVIDHDLIVQEGRYVYNLTQPTKEDLDELEICAQGQSGTLVRISKLFHESLPRTSEIVEGLRTRARVIYYYFLKGMVDGLEPVTLKIDDHDVEAVNPLFEDEIAPDDADLNENSWDGLSPKWITRPQHIQVTTDGDRYAEVAMTQLVHPPTVERAGSMSRRDCRDHYMIGAGNYGFYIYRNFRLISWADSLGFVSPDQDHYAFRGRLLIRSDSDDVLNIDVTKSRIHLSEIAQEQLKPQIQESLKKSRDAWRNAKRNITRAVSENPHDTANEDLNRISNLQADDDKRDENVASLEERKKLEARRKKAEKSKPINEEDHQHVTETGHRVLYVDTLDNDQLWERAHDPTHGLIVRVNKSHRFCQGILDAVYDNNNLLKVIDVLFFALARGEYDLVYKSEHDDDEIEAIMAEYRERVGETLSGMIRRLDPSSFLAEA
ncbi:MAG: ATP-binding protein [Candidatus Poribacteria bacterium]|nr:ATP-binding protein [Candidatus Poribacteria bacterium]